ncbi:MAG: RluA family pseudouridine synthase [Pirellulales bacterium]|nr:RluA family pseudouridine synthase [Pirellulales bacterium]
MEIGVPQEFVVSAEETGQRLDRFLALRIPGYSRTLLRKAVGAGAGRINGRGAKPATIVNTGDTVTFILPEMPRTGPEPEAIPLDIIFEDDHVIVVNKPAGMVVHPARGHWSGTLASALAHHCEQLSSVGGLTRPGIVHRLDRDTTGVIVVAKTDAVHGKLAEQFAERSVEKEYLALVNGAAKLDSDHIDQPIAPHKTHREKMAISREGHPQARSAKTFFQVEERLGRYTLLQAKPVTGRTHQIRVHLKSIGCPVLCDKLYGGRAELLASEIATLSASEEDRVILARQALHAAKLSLTHPLSGERLSFEAPIPNDMVEALKLLRREVN